MMEEPQHPEDEPREGVPGEPGEATPSESAPDGADQPVPEPPQEEAPEPSQDDAPAGEGAEHPGPEIEGIEELAQAAETVGTDETAEAEEAPEAETDEAPAAATEEEQAPRAERPRPGARRRQADGGGGDEVIPGAHLEPDLVLEEEQRPTEPDYGEYGEYAEPEAAEAAEATAEPAEEAPPEEQPLPHTPLDLAADARYKATGKRKRAVARVTLRPGEGTYTINGRHLDEYFPRVRLQRMASQPLEATGNQARMDVVALIHGGGVAAQATALRHGIARALVEADPALRGELKGRGYLTRDPRVKERKKAGLKKARKRPQFSKR
jgi:small subunit ribosomal protein S9